MTALTVEELYKHHADELSLHWLAGEMGNERTIELENNQTLGSVGYFNLIHPHQIQIIGAYEKSYFDTIEKAVYQSTLKQLFENENVCCIILIDNIEIPTDLKRYAEKHQIPLLTSQLSGENIINYLHTTFAKMIAPRTNLHGVFMDVLGMGVLIMGSSGTGKSELALELVSRGHRLVADDTPEFYRVSSTVLNGTCPVAGMTPFLEVRGLGILNVQALFGDSAIKKEKFLRLIVQLEHMTTQQLQNIDRLQGDYRVRRILDVEVPEIGLPVAPGRNLAVLLECAVRNYSLKVQGYNAADEFCTLQRQLIQGNNLH